MNLYELFHLTGRCFCIDNSPDIREQVTQRFADKVVPFQHFVHVSDRCLVLPAVTGKLERNGLLDFFPPDLAGCLRDIYSANASRNLRIIEQCKEIHQTLQLKGIEHVFLKGAAHLLDGLYDGPGERLVGDIDFLVRESDYMGAVEVLKADGYGINCPLYCEVWRKNHYYPLIKQGGATYVEVHQAISRKYKKLLSGEDVFQRRQQAVGCSGIYVPCDEHKVMHNFIHSQLINDGHLLKEVSLRSVCDLYLLSGRVDLENVLHHLPSARGKAEGYFLFSAEVLGLGSRFYHTCSREARLYCRLSAAALRYTRGAKAYRKSLTVLEIIFKGYICRIISAFYRQSSRRYLISRLSAPWWYKEHFAKLKRKIFK